MPHIHELIDYTASVYVVHEDAVLLRMHEKYGKWLPPGGHIELHEDPNTAALREVKEETGLEVQLAGSIPNTTEGTHTFINLIPPVYMNMHQIKTDSAHQHCDHIYFAIATTRTLTPHEDEASVEMRWFTKQELEDPTYELWPSVQFYAQEALKMLGTS